MLLSRRRTLFVPAVMLVAVVGLAACGSDSKDSTKTSTDTNESTSSTAASGGIAVVKTASVPSVGTILVDANGKAVYTLTKDGAAVACTGACLGAWPPVLLPAGTDTATGAKDLTVVTITEGKQVASGGLPLYTFSGDATAGTANGEGLASFGGTWHVVKVGGAATGSSTTDTSDTSSGGYDY